MNYDIRLDDKYGQMNLVDIPAEIAAHEPWFNQTLTTVNDSVVRLGIIEGDFHWHKQDGEGVVHRTCAPERTVIVMVESKGVDPTGD